MSKTLNAFSQNSKTRSYSVLPRSPSIMYFSIFKLLRDSTIFKFFFIGTIMLRKICNKVVKNTTTFALLVKYKCQKSLTVIT